MTCIKLNLKGSDLVDIFVLCEVTVSVRINTWAGQIASHSLQAMQRSSPDGYLKEHHVKDFVNKLPLPEVLTFMLPLTDIPSNKSVMTH